MSENIRPASCRFCNTPLKTTFIDLGMQPLCENFLKVNQLNQMEPFFPLRVYICNKCFHNIINEQCKKLCDENITKKRSKTKTGVSHKARNSCSYCIRLREASLTSTIVTDNVL